MNRGHGRGRGGYNQGSPSKTGPRGQLIDGIWHCDCDPRMPAEHFQTKNGGKNHVYTCQKPQPKRCKFFLWDDDAKNREKVTVLNNSRSEPGKLPSTPKKRSTIEEQVTPSRTASSLPSRHNVPSTDRTLDHEESYDWPSSEEDIFADAESVLQKETARKASKTIQFSSPGKRTHTEMEADDVFATPTTSTKGKGGLLSPEDTPALDRVKDGPTKSMDLVSEVLEKLSSVKLSADVQDQLVELLNRHELRFQGIARGRDISRLAIQNKDKQIAELEARVAGLEAERDTSKLVIAHLKHDISSPKKKKG